MLKREGLKSGFGSRGPFRQVMICMGMVFAALLLSAQERQEDAEVKPASAAGLIQLAEKYLNTSPDKALNYAEQALPLAREKGDKVAEGNAFLQIGLAHRNLGSYDKSLNALQEALDIFEIAGDGMRVAAVLNTLGQVYGKLDNSEKARECFQKALKLREESGDKKGVAQTLKNLGEMEIKAKNYTRAAGYMEQALKIGQEIKSRDLLRDIYLTFSQLHDARGDFRNAYQYYQQFSQMKDEIIRAQANYLITELQTKYIFAKRESEIAGLQKDRALSELGQKRKRVLKIALLAGVLLLLSGLAALLVLRSRWQREIAGIKREIVEKESQLQSASRRLEELAKADGLTGVANRHFYESWLEREWRHLQRNLSPMSLVIIDIDFFKLYNDTYGHHAGDECLKAVAKVLWENTRRAADLVGRYGGEEFIVIMPTTPPAGAVQVAEKMRRAVEDLHIPHEKSACSDVVTISLGVAAAVPQKGSGYDQLLAAAGQALLASKNGGRNRLEIAAETTGAPVDKNRIKGPKKGQDREDR